MIVTINHKAVTLSELYRCSVSVTILDADDTQRLYLSSHPQSWPWKLVNSSEFVVLTERDGYMWLKKSARIWEPGTHVLGQSPKRTMSSGVVSSRA